MTKLITTYLLLLVAINSFAQEQLSITGKILDSITKEPLVGAVIYSKEYPKKAVNTDTNGAFNMFLPKGNHTIICSYLGYLTLEKNIELIKSQEITFSMQENAQQVQDVVILANGLTEKLDNTQIGVEQIKMKDIAKMPTLFGERDIIRSIQLLPGIKAESDGSTGFQVRGGTSAQNLILLDDATVYNAGHLMGIFSTFNDNAINSASLYKGLIPAQFGGGTSSVLDVNSANGNMQSYNINGSVGILAAKLSIDGPIVKNKASFFVSMRRTYFDMYLKLLDDFKDNVMNFYDINARVDYNINDKNKLFVSFFKGNDNMGLDNLIGMKWGNQTANIRWFHQFNSNHYSNTSIFQSTYLSDNTMDILERNYLIKGHTRQVGLKQYFNYSPSNKHNINYGFQTSYINLKSGEWNLNYTMEKEQRKAIENSIWINDEYKLSSQLSILAGVRFNAFSALGGSPYYKLDSNGDITEIINYNDRDIVKTYLAIEPRISAKYQLSPLQSFKIGYARTSQNIQAIRSSFTSFPIDRYTMSSNITKPQTADQASIGYIRLSNNSKYEFSAEGYYKTIENVLDYKDGKSFTSEIEIERLILAGKGRSYGLEFSTKKNTGQFTGWVAYTLAWSENKIPGINNDNWYTAGNDRRHDISIVGMYELSKKWRLTATWVYNTGQALTAPSAKYDINGETYYYYAERNGYRAPAYHRLDFSATYSNKKHEWAFGFYNLYNRYNPFIITFENDDTKPSGTKTMQQSLYGILPSVSYTFKL